MATRELDVTVRRRDDGVPVLDLVGDIDASADAALAAAYASVADASAVELSFARTEYINSTGIALIVRLLADARTRGVALTASGLSEHYRTIFEITRLADFMQIADD